MSVNFADKWAWSSYTLCNNAKRKQNVRRLRFRSANAYNSNTVKDSRSDIFTYTSFAQCAEYVLTMMYSIAVPVNCLFIEISPKAEAVKQFCRQTIHLLTTAVL